MAIIRELAVEGSRMLCGAIDASELYRLRVLRVDADYLLPGDFLGLVNLRELEAVVGRFPLVSGVFLGMPSLHRMELTVVRRGVAPGDVSGMLVPGVFGGLEGLERLDLNGRRNLVGFHLDRRALRGLDGLVDLDVDSVAFISPDALSDMPALRRVCLNAAYTPPHRRDERPALPPGLFNPCRSWMIYGCGISVRAVPLGGEVHPVSHIQHSPSHSCRWASAWAGVFSRSNSWRGMRWLLRYISTRLLSRSFGMFRSAQSTCAASSNAPGSVSLRCFHSTSVRKGHPMHRSFGRS